MSSRETAAYIRPFLTNVLKAAELSGAVIDKTIGDEVMFVLPQAGQAIVLGKLCEFCRVLHDSFTGTKYRLKVGLAYGRTFIDCVGEGDYGEWTAVGETVNLAKRAMGLIDGVPEGETSRLAFGALTSEMDAETFGTFVSRIRESMPQFCSFQHGIVNTLKGISESRCATFFDAPLVYLSGGPVAIK